MGSEESLSDLEELGEQEEIAEAEPPLSHLKRLVFEVTGAGSAEFNGTYRWFHETNNFVKFSRGATYTLDFQRSQGGYLWHLSKLNDSFDPEHYYSNLCTSPVPSPDSWNCLLGVAPAPEINQN